MGNFESSPQLLLSKITTFIDHPAQPLQESARDTRDELVSNPPSGGACWICQRASAQLLIADHANQDYFCKDCLGKGYEGAEPCPPDFKRESWYINQMQNSFFSLVDYQGTGLTAMEKSVLLRKRFQDITLMALKMSANEEGLYDRQLCEQILPYVMMRK